MTRLCRFCFPNFPSVCHFSLSASPPAHTTSLLPELQHVFQDLPCSSLVCCRPAATVILKIYKAEPFPLFQTLSWLPIDFRIRKKSWPTSAPPSRLGPSLLSPLCTTGLSVPPTRLSPSCHTAFVVCCCPPGTQLPAVCLSNACVSLRRRP